MLAAQAHVEQQAEMEPSAEAPWLVGDVGGTNARFGLLTSSDRPPSDIRVLATRRHANLVSLLSEYLQPFAGIPIHRACIAFAGPVLGDHCRTTNAGLAFSIRQTAEAIGIRRLEVINDLAATAFAAHDTRDGEYVTIGSAGPIPGLPLAVVGPGTGLGVATLIPQQAGRPIVLATEGGHVALAATDDVELEVIRAARAQGLSLTAEMVVSGPGLVRLHGLLAIVHGYRPTLLRAEGITARALAGSDEQCTQAVRTFCNFLGTVAAGVALTSGARGGLYLTGNILRQIATFLVDPRFRERFEANTTMSRYLRRIGITLLLEPYPALRGAAVNMQSWSSV